MSSISAQYNLLQTVAAYMVVHDMPDVAASVREASDTILELRDNLQRANDENAKLRKLSAQMVKTVECDSCVLFSECAVGRFEQCLYEQKLRELRIEVDW